MPDETMQPMVDLMEQVWSSLDELFSTLDDADWDLPTECPEWTVKDQLSHLNGNETLILGLAEGDEAAADMTVANAAQVAARRPKTPEELLSEFRGLVSKRLGVLRAMEPADWDEPRPTPVGPMPTRVNLGFRIFDAWTHEQDVRRATGRPGHADGAVAAHCFGLMRAGMPFAVGKRAAPPDGATVLFDLSGGPATPFAIGMQDGRGAETEPPADPTARVRTDFETFMRLTAGRISADAALDAGAVTLEGDAALGRRVLDGLVVVP